MTLRSWNPSPPADQRTLETTKQSKNIFSRGLTAESEMPELFEMSCRFSRSEQIRG